MNQMRFSDFEYAGRRKQTRRERFLAEMDQVVPWTGLLGLIEPFYPKAGGGRKPYPLETMLRIHLLQNWFSMSYPVMEAALYEITPMRQFARLTLSAPIPEDTKIMNFRHLLENHNLGPAILAVINGYLQEKGLSLRQSTIVDATIIHAPSSTNNEEGKRDPEMHQTKKGNQYFFSMKAYTSADAESGLVHHVHGTAANVADVTLVAVLLHGEENAVYADTGYTGVEKHEEHENRRSSGKSPRGAARIPGSINAACSTRSSAKSSTAISDTGQGRASVSGDQTSVWLRESALSWADEKHSSADHAVRPVESVDGSKTADGYG
jgi:IS5 family transposase